MAVKMMGNGLPADMRGTPPIMRRLRATHPEELGGLPADGSDTDRLDSPGRSSPDTIHRRAGTCRLGSR